MEKYVLENGEFIRLLDELPVDVEKWADSLCSDLPDAKLVEFHRFVENSTFGFQQAITDYKVFANKKRVGFLRKINNFDDDKLVNTSFMDLTK